MKEFISIFLVVLVSCIIGKLIFIGLPEIGIPLFVLTFIFIVLFKDKFNKDEYTYWLITVEKPFKRENKIVITSTLKIKNNFFSKKDIDEYYNELYSETGKWNILFYSELTKKEYDIYNSNEN